MRGTARQVSATRVALLELKDERHLVEEGYELLDEKRMLIAAEIRRELEEHRRLAATVAARLDAVRDAFAAALRRHGLDELQCLPPWTCPDARLESTHRPFLGVDLVTAELEAGDCGPTSTPAFDSAEARQTVMAHKEALHSIAALAASEVSLRRLVAEYVRTERRARALENVLLPEIHATLRFVEDQLESLDQEEAVRARHRGGSRAATGHEADPEHGRPAA
ncbi:MAG TPA: V-type ATP synthase subunit D [Steroidobacteraceae bacterium]|nr:V-type ATP synthase subunit D [Steroidobacteraceae bacterium]